MGQAPTPTGPDYDMYDAVAPVQPQQETSGAGSFFFSAPSNSAAPTGGSFVFGAASNTAASSKADSEMTPAPSSAAENMPAASMGPTGGNFSGQTVMTAAPASSAYDIDPALLSSPGDIDPALFSNPDAPSAPTESTTAQASSAIGGQDKGKGKAPMQQTPTGSAETGPSSSNIATTQGSAAQKQVQAVGQGEAGPSTARRPLAKPKGRLNKAKALGLVDTSVPFGPSQGQCSTKQYFRYSHGYLRRFREHLREGFLGTSQAPAL